MQILAKLVLLSVFLFSIAVSASAQEPKPNFNKELDEETPQQQKQEAERPDTKASAGDLAKATQNPVASLVSIPLQNLTDFNIGPFGRDRNTVLQFQAGVPHLAVQTPNRVLVSEETEGSGEMRQQCPFCKKGEHAMRAIRPFKTREHANCRQPRRQARLRARRADKAT